MRFVIRPVNRERLAPRVGLIGLRDLHDPDRLFADEEPDPIGSRHIVRAENDRDREGRAAREAALRDHRFVVLATQESIDRRQGARAEHEDVRQLALTDLQLRQTPGLSPELRQLLPRGKSLERRARQMAEPLQPVEHLHHRLGEALDRRIADHLRMERFLVRVAHAGEVRDLAGDGLAVKAFGVPLDQRVKRRPHEHLDEVRRLAAQLVAHLAIRRNRCRDRDTTAPRDEPRHVADAPDVRVAVFFGEPETLGEMGAHLVAVEQLGVPASTRELGLQRGRNRRFARS